MIQEKYMLKKWLIILIVVHLSIVIFYSGRQFIRHLQTHIPSSPTYGTHFADHIENLYPHLLPKYNIIYGHSLYYSGYQLNIDNPLAP